MKRSNEKNLKSIAFPCISTGVFGYPKDKAAAVAVKTVKKFLAAGSNIEEVIFVTFGDEDLSLYKKLLKNT